MLDDVLAVQQLLLNVLIDIVEETVSGEQRTPCRQLPTLLHWCKNRTSEKARNEKKHKKKKEEKYVLSG